jgi:hypothetical protein
MRLIVGKPRRYNTTPVEKNGIVAVSRDLELAVRELAASVQPVAQSARVDVAPTSPATSIRQPLSL